MRAKKLSKGKKQALSIMMLFVTVIGLLLVLTSSQPAPPQMTFDCISWEIDNATGDGQMKCVKWTSPQAGEILGKSHP